MAMHCRRLTGFGLLALSAAAVFGALNSQATTLGHSRVTSSPDQPLRIVVQLKDVQSAEQASLTAQIAPLSAWQDAGLTPPVQLSTLKTDLIAGFRPNTLQLVVQSNQVAQAPVVDVLVEIKSDSATQRHQVSVLQATTSSTVVLAPSTSTHNAVSATAAKPIIIPSAPALDSTVVVQKNQTLSAIARQLRSDEYTDQQMMMALLQANPNAFIHKNINLLKAGVQLHIPDTATVTALSPQQANQLYQQHVQWYDEYRQRLAKGLAPVAMGTDTPKASGSTDDQSSPSLEAVTDRLQLASATEATQKADQATAIAQELDYTAQRLAQLESSDGGGGTANLTSGSEQSTTQSDSQSLIQAASTAAAATVASPNDSTTTTSNQVSSDNTWFGQNKWTWLIGLLALVALLVAWFLRRGHNSGEAYAEAVPSSSDRMREKLQKNTVDLDSPATDEVEFREIK